MLIVMNMTTAQIDMFISDKFYVVGVCRPTSGNNTEKWIANSWSCSYEYILLICPYSSQMKHWRKLCIINYSQKLFFCDILLFVRSITRCVL